MVTAHVPVPEQPSPLHPVKIESAAGKAVSVTEVPSVKDAMHVPPQLIPPGWLATVPLPVPVFVTVRLWTFSTKLAVTVQSAVTGPVVYVSPASVPLHPVTVPIR
jgi:hypothetical protein